MMNISFIYTAKNSSHQLQEIQNFVQAFITETQRNDLIIDLEPPENKAELLASRLQRWNLLDHAVKVTTFRTQNKDSEKFYQTEGDFTVCKDVDGLLAAMNMRHFSDEWRLFIDAAKIRRKAVLLHNENKLPSIPIAYSVHTKQTSENMNNVLLGV